MTTGWKAGRRLSASASWSRWKRPCTSIRCGCWRSIIRRTSTFIPTSISRRIPPYPPFKVVVSRDARPPAGAWDDHGHNVLPDLLAHRYFGDFALTQFQGFAKPHSLTLDLGEAYRGGPLWLLMHGEVEYFSANSMYAASQAGMEAISPYVEALGAQRPVEARNRRHGISRRRSAHHDCRSHRQTAAGHAEDSHHDQSSDLLGQHSGRPYRAVVPRSRAEPAHNVRFPWCVPISNSTDIR